MAAPSTSPNAAKKAFKDTVQIYRNDFNHMLKNPIPLVLGLVGLLVFLLIVKSL